jgi:hypothetical protein
MNTITQRRSSTSRSRVEQLIEDTSRPGWDDEGGVVIDAQRWNEARELADRAGAEVPNAPEVFFAACGDGSIHLRWADAERSLDAEIDGATFHWVVRANGARTRAESARASDLIQALRVVFA